MHYVTSCVSSIRDRTLMWLSGTSNSVEINVLLKVQEFMRHEIFHGMHVDKREREREREPRNAAVSVL